MKSKREQWFSDLLCAGFFHRSPTDRTRVNFPGGIADFESIPGRPGRGIRLRSLYVHKPQRGRGIGTAVLRRVLRAADRFGWTLQITPRAFSARKGPPTEFLFTWYARFGFVTMRSDHDRMLRRPAQRHRVMRKRAAA